MGCGSSSIPPLESVKEDNRYVSPNKNSQTLHANSNNNDNNNDNNNNNNSCGDVAVNVDDNINFISTSAVYSDKNDESKPSDARALSSGDHSQGRGDIRMDHSDIYFEIFCKCKYGTASYDEVLQLTSIANNDNDRDDDGGSFSDNYYLALSFLGQLYLKGTRYTILNVDKAREYNTQCYDWLLKTAGKDKYKLCNLGFCYEHGFGVEKDEAEAFHLYILAAANQYSYAYCLLGICYKNGIGTTKDLSKAIECFRLSGNLGYIPAWSNLGLCYENGIGVLKDLSEAVRMYRIAAEAGYAPAQNCLGVCFDNGYGTAVGIDRGVEAVKWYRKASEQGYAPAQVCTHDMT